MLYLRSVTCYLGYRVRVEISSLTTIKNAMGKSWVREQKKSKSSGVAGIFLGDVQATKTLPRAHAEGPGAAAPKDGNEV